jgi:hypothetical protein
VFDEYQVCSSAHFAGGPTTESDACRFNVEVIGRTRMVQNHVEQVADRHHLFSASCPISSLRTGLLRPFLEQRTHNHHDFRGNRISAAILNSPRYFT